MSKRIARIALPGYPRQGKIETKEEVEVYFSGDKIQCLLCGKWYKQLAVHLSLIHGVRVDEYRERYGLPWSRGLSCRDTKNKRSRLARRLMLEGKITPIDTSRPMKKKHQRHAQPFNRDLKHRCLTLLDSIGPKYTREDYEKVIDRMRKQQRCLKDVCGDPDLPGSQAVRSFMKKNPEYGEEVQQAYFSMPYFLQARYRKFSPRFIEECQRLRNQPMTLRAIGEKLGVSIKFVQKALMKARGDLKSEETTKEGIAPTSKTKAFSLRKGGPKIFRREDYEAAVDIVRQQQRSLSDVLRDPALPSKVTFLKFVRKQPDLKEKLQRAYFSMPYSLQLKYGSAHPRFIKDCQRLRSRGLTQKKIAEALGVSFHCISRHLRKASSKEEPKKKTRRKRKGTPRGNGPSCDVFRPVKYSRKDYEAIVERMREQGRGLDDVCGDPDLPSYSRVFEYKKRRPEFEGKILQAYYSMPYFLQVKYKHPSPGLLVDCRCMFERGMSLRRIADALQIPFVTVRRIVKKTVGKTALSNRTPRGQRVKWKREDYEAILERIWSQQRFLSDVCKDSDLPAVFSWLRYIKKRPELEEKSRKIHHRLPYSFQVVSKQLSPRFQFDCERLFARGMFMTRIAKALGVPVGSVKRVLRNSDDDRPWGRP